MMRRCASSRDLLTPSVEVVHYRFFLRFLTLLIRWLPFPKTWFVFWLGVRLRVPYFEPVAKKAARPFAAPYRLMNAASAFLAPVFAFTARFLLRAIFSS
jgi:hypothetical protein